MPSSLESPILESGPYFNDLSRQPSVRSSHSASPVDDGPAREQDNGIPRPKRIACIICRKRKLKCDGTKPCCGTCSRLGHKCSYDEVRRKSGPKRGYVKELEARLAQVETQLKTTKERVGNPGLSRTSSYRSVQQTGTHPGFQLNDLDMGMRMGEDGKMLGLSADRSSSLKQASPGIASSKEPSNHSWEMIGLGLEEPLPPQDMIEDLHQIFFEKIHPALPMMHKYRYLAALNLAPKMRPPVCLRYAMWALAASVTEKYYSYQEIFYHRARRYVEADEIKGHGESIITVGHAQAWNLITAYEFKMMYFPRAWLSTGRSIRMVQMMSLHRMDGIGLEVKQCLPPPRDWTDREERRRTFWVAYCADRYASIGTGWPMMVEEKDILTNLPASDEAFDRSRAEQAISLTEAMSSEGASSLSSMAGVVLMASLFGRNLAHLHRPEVNDRPEDLTNGEFWKRHRNMDSILLNTSMFLPAHLRLPTGARDTKIAFLNMNIHTSTICLHQAAILKIEKHNLGAAAMKQSNDRCLMAAEEIVGIMRLISHVDIGTMHPFLSFCLYVGARVFVQAYKKAPEDPNVYKNLEFLLSAMQALRRKHALTESFLVQLIVDLEGTGLDNPLNNSRFSFAAKKGMSENCTENIGAPPVYPTRKGPLVAFHLPSNVASDDPAQSVVNNRAHGGLTSSPQYNSVGVYATYDQFNSPQQEMSTASMGWGDKFPGGPESAALSPPNALNPQSHMMENMDTDMSTDSHVSDPHTASASGRDTPSGSRNSSHTSYSPPQQYVADKSDDPGMRIPLNMQQGGGVPSYLNPAAPFAAFGVQPLHAPLPQRHQQSRQHHYQQQQQHTIHHQQQNHPHPASHTPMSQQQQAQPGEAFGMAPAWGIGSDVPGVENLSPLGEGNWTQMFAGMGWDSGLAAGGEMSWRGARDS